jgi:DNA-binding SARP family transcriptional activator
MNTESATWGLNMEFRVLGRLEVVSDTGDVMPAPRPLVRAAIFGLVLHRNRSLAPERLVDLLWGADAGADPLHTLRNCIWGVRKALPPDRLVTDDIGYRLRIDAERDRTDVDRFRRLHREGRAALCRGDNPRAATLLGEAMGLWRDLPLTDLYPGTPVMRSLMMGLTEEQRDARNALVQARLGLGQHRELLPQLRTLVTAEPANERLWADLMLTLYRCDLKAEALQVFDEARAALRISVGVQPGAELHRLQRQIQADDPALAPDPVTDPEQHQDAGRGIVPRQLPSDLMDFTGRTVEAAELIGLLSPAEGGTAVPVAEVTGPPGVGKSVLAVHVAHAVAHDYPDGQLHIRLAGASPTPPTAGAVLGEVLRMLGVAAAEIPETTQQRAALYRSRLADRRMLIVLDDAASPERVRPLVPGMAGCAVIVTSRVRLVGLTSGRSMSLAPLEHPDALCLLARIIGRARLVR